MAAATLPAPGTGPGPCLGPCEHRDCASVRAMAASTCESCGEAIGYCRAFLNPQGPPELAAQGDPAAWAGRLAHEGCLLAELERADARADERREGRAARLAAVRYEALAAMTAEGLTPEPQADDAALVRRFSVARVTFEAERVEVVDDQRRPRTFLTDDEGWPARLVRHLAEATSPPAFLILITHKGKPSTWSWRPVGAPRSRAGFASRDAAVKSLRASGFRLVDRPAQPSKMVESLGVRRVDERLQLADPAGKG